MQPRTRPELAPNAVPPTAGNGKPDGQPVARSASPGGSRWMLFERSLVLGRPAGPGGATERLIAYFAPCAEPTCPCPRLDLRLLRVPDDVAGSFDCGDREPFDALAYEYAAIDLETGVVRAGADPQVGQPASDDVLAWLRDELDGELLDHLWTARCRLKGTSSPIDWNELFEVGALPGDLVSYAGVFPGERVDGYSIDGRIFQVDDEYCAEHGCDCDQVDLDVGEEVDGLYEWRGRVGVSVSDGAVLERLGGPEDEAIVERVWQAVRVRHAVVPRYRSRMDRLRELRAAHRAPPPPRAGPRVGRNDPCPCGSGKKFKKCCEGRDGPAAPGAAPSGSRTGGR